jgi:hypothetical protein
VSEFCRSSELCSAVPSVTNVNAKFWKGGRFALLRNCTAAQFFWTPITHFTTKRLEISAALF